jgi:hypothetical protein
MTGTAMPPWRRTVGKDIRRVMPIRRARAAVDSPQLGDEDVDLRSIAYESRSTIGRQAERTPSGAVLS